MIKIHNIDEVYVWVECDQGIAWELRDHFTFKVPGAHFMPSYRRGGWDGEIRLFDVRTNRIYRGLVPRIEKFCEERDYEFSYDYFNNEFSIKEAWDFIETLGLPFKPRDYQVDAFVHAIREKRLLLLSPTASGKSLIIYLITRYFNTKTLIVVPTISLVDQMTGDFADYGLDTEKNVHKIYSGQDKISDKQIYISTWQSIFSLKKGFFDQFQTVIGDESHSYKSKSLISIMTKLTNAENRIGTTGTLDGLKTNQLVIEGLFGKTRQVASTADLMEKGIVADFSIKCLILKHDEQFCKLATKWSYHEEISYLVGSESRNRFIKNLALSLNGNTLVLFNYIEHGSTLFEMINTNEREVYFIYGKTAGEEREEIRKLMETKKNAIIVASYGTFAVGVNIKNLHNVIFASPSKSRIRNLQSIGRSLRKSDTKSSAVLYDISDDLRYKKHVNYTLGHYEERIKIYVSEKFRFKVYKIQLKEKQK